MPIFQALEDFTVYLILIAIERLSIVGRTGHGATGYPSGTVLGTAMILWGIERSLDEHLWLGEDGRLGSDLVQLAGVLLVIGGAVILVRTRRRWKQWLRTHMRGMPRPAHPWRAADTTGLTSRWSWPGTRRVRATQSGTGLIRADGDGHIRFSSAPALTTLVATSHGRRRAVYA